MPVNPHIKGGPDVPVVDGGTGASDAATGLSNLGGLDTTAHASVNHAGIPGVGDLTVAAHSTTDHTGFTGVGQQVQQIRAIRQTSLALPTVIPHDSTIPQIGEGTEVLTAAITPTSLSNILMIEFTGHGDGPASGAATTALFRDAISNALAATTSVSGNGSSLHVLRYFLLAPSLSSQTYRIRVGWNNGAATLNSATFGGVASSVLTVTEFTP